MEEKCVYCGGDLPEKPTKVKVRTRSFEVCCADCAEKTEQYIKLDKRFKTALYLLVFLGGIGFVISAFFGGDSPLRMIGAYAGQLVAGLTFIAFPYPVTSFESFHAMSIRGVTRLTRIIGLVLSVSAVDKENCAIGLTKVRSFHNPKGRSKERSLGFFAGLSEVMESKRTEGSKYLLSFCGENYICILFGDLNIK